MEIKLIYLLVYTSKIHYEGWEEKKNTNISNISEVKW